MKRNMLTLLLLALSPLLACANDNDSLPEQGHYVHMVRTEAATGAILHTNEYLKGGNEEGRTMNHSFVAKLKYAFMKPQNTVEAHIYKGAYQGIGVAWHEFNPQLSNPVSAFIFQGARIATLASRLSLNYEWNLGVTCGWKPYDKLTNPDNKVIGSRVTAFINTDFYLNWQISRAVNRYRLPVIVCYVGLEQVNEKTIRNFWAWLPNKIRKYIGRDSARMCHIPLTKDKLERALGAFSVNNGTYPWNSTTIF